MSGEGTGGMWIQQFPNRKETKKSFINEWTAMLLGVTFFAFLIKSKFSYALFG